MISELSIRNFAIIDDLKIQFSRGLTILSGETGAGKSIIVNAVNLLLGSRASPQLIRSGAESAELEAQFNFASDNSLSKALEEINRLEHLNIDSREEIEKLKAEIVTRNGDIRKIKKELGITTPRPRKPKTEAAE